ncbi:MAG: hypothetical protein EOO07_21110, partial [Chitinophagaceae bacterium]
MSFKFTTFYLFLFCFVGVRSYGQSTTKLPYHSADFKSIETGFVHIPDSVQTSVYWYWLSDNVTKEGVIKDLEAMKKVGINRAFIGNIGMGELPFGNAKLFSDNWWEVLHT